VRDDSEKLLERDAVILVSNLVQNHFGNQVVNLQHEKQHGRWALSFGQMEWATMCWPLV
jgi:hypothetical protein